MKIRTLLAVTVLFLLFAGSSYALPTSHSCTYSDARVNSLSDYSGYVPNGYYDDNNSNWSNGGFADDMGFSNNNNPYANYCHSSELESGRDDVSYSFVVNSVPEPTTLILIGLGLAGLGLRKM